MVTGAALATINRLPVLLLPADTFADRSASPLLQELELPDSGDVTVNDAFRPVSKYFDRVWRPEQLPAALLSAMRVLTDPAETGAVTLCFPQDVQAEAYDWPTGLFEKRVWHVARPLPERSVLEAAAAIIKSAKRPLIVAGGGVQYSRAQDALAAFCEATGIPVGQSQAGKGTLVYDHPQCLGAIGSTGTTAANAIAREADVVIGIGTRYSDFTTASRTAFQNPDVRFVNINVAGLDAIKHAGLAVSGRRPRGTRAPCCRCWRAIRSTESYAETYNELNAAWEETVEKVIPASESQCRGRRPAHPERGDRHGERAVRPARRGRLRRRIDARRPAQAVADPRPEGLPRGVRLLLHGLRGRRRARRTTGLSGPRCFRHGRRRLVSDDGDRAGHGGPGGHQDHHGAGAEPRLRLDRLAVGVTGLAAVRHQVPVSEPGNRAAGRRQAAGRSCCQRREPRASR